MISSGTSEFWELYRALPQDVKRTAKKAYLYFQIDPFHSSLHFKDLGDGFWSVRVGIHYRAIGKRTGANAIVWQWIGSHERYNNLIR
jgi:hypothetical protein